MVELTPVMKKFILHWGEMGGTWGVNRTVAQIHALLYLSAQPLTAEEITDALSLARSTVSTGLHELQSWGIVRVVHVLGDRRDHFEAMTDVWEMFRTILDERKRREVDPTLEMLRECVTALEKKNGDAPYVKERLEQMLDFFEVINKIYDQVEGIPTETLTRVARMSDNLGKVVDTVVRR